MQVNRDRDWQGKMLGRYSLIRLLGHGGMGEVWQAEDTELHRQVAVKLLPFVRTNETDYLRAFAREARTIASLEHPHILPVHDFGEEHSDNGIITYLIMPLITGGSLADRIKAVSGLLSPDESLSYLRQAAQAIDYAHTRQVLHRDIKPANILLQQQWLLLADFGIAKLLSTATVQTQTHSGSGTPDYMAPEQALGKAEAASDRYSLAVIAYQLFSGRKPFSGSNPYEILLKHVQEIPPSPGTFNPQLSSAVDMVLLRGLAKHPDARFHSCVAFVDALEMSLRMGTTSSATQDPDATLLAPWSKRALASQETRQVTAPAEDAEQRHPTTSPLLPPSEEHAVSAPFVSDQRIQPSVEPLPAASETTNAPEQPRKIERRGVLIGGAVAVVLVGGTALAFTLRSRANSPVADSISRPVPGPRKLIAGVPLLRLTGHTKAVWNVIWHPSGRYLATAGDDTHILLWDVEPSLDKDTKKALQEMSQPLHDWKLSDIIFSNCLGWSKDGSTLAALVVTESNTLHLIANQQRVPTTYSDHSQTNSFDQPTYSALAWSPIDNHFAVSVSLSMDAEIWQAGHVNGPLKALKGPVAPRNEGGTVEVDQLAWSFDGAFLAGLRNDSDVVVWNAKTGQILQSLALPDRTQNSQRFVRRNAITWSPHTRSWLAVTDYDIVTVWDAQANKLLARLTTDDPAAQTTTVSGGITIGVQVNGLAWSPNGRYLAGSYEHSHQVYIWDMQNQTPKKTKEGFQIQDMLFGANSGHGESAAGSQGVSKNVTIIDLSWSPDGRYLATASNDTTIVVWQVDGS